MLIHELVTAIALAAAGPLADTGSTGPASSSWFGTGRVAPRLQRVDDNDDDRDDDDGRDDRDGGNDPSDGDDDDDDRDDDRGDG